MKITFFLIIAGLGLLWFANDSIKDVGLIFYNGEEWIVTGFIGWKVLVGSWVIFLTVALAVALLFAGLVACLAYNYEEREKALKTQLSEDKQKGISELEKIHASQIEKLFFQQTNNSKHLEKSYADVEKYKRMLAHQENDNSLLVQKIKGKDAVIMRLKRKIDRLQMPRL